MVYGLLQSAITGKVCAFAFSWFWCSRVRSREESVILVFACTLANVTLLPPAGLHRWLQVAAIENAVSETDIFASCTCHYNIITLVYVKMLIVGNTGHLDNEID